MSYSHLTSLAFGGVAKITQVSHINETLTSWELLDSKTNRVLYHGEFIEGIPFLKVAQPIEVSHYFSDPGNCCEYFKTSDGVVFALQKETHHADQWYSVVSATCEPSAPVGATFLHSQTGEEITSRSQVKTT